MEWALDLVVLVMLPAVVTFLVDMATGWGYIRPVQGSHG